MADTTTLLRVQYGESGNMPEAADALYGTMFVTLDSHQLAFKLPTGSTNVADDLFYIRTPHASIANQVNNSLNIVYSTATSAAGTFNGAAAQTVFVGSKPIVGASTSATANTTTTNTGTYLNILNRTGSNNDSWVSSGGIKIVGSGATTVSAADGVITIGSTNTTHATRPNPYTLNVIYGTGTTSATYSGAAANTFYGGGKLIFATANTKTAPEATNNTTTYLNLLTRVTASTYEVANGLQIQGSGATTVTATSTGVLTINSTNTTYATRPNPSAIVFKYGVSSSTSASYDGNTAQTIYGGASLIVGNATTSTANASSATNNTATYLNLLTRTGNSAYSVANTIKITGSGAASVSANGGVITINATNTTYATRPNPAAIAIKYGTSSSTSVNYDGNTAQTIYAGSKLIVGASTSATANATTANTSTYLNILARTDNDSWAVSGTGIQIKGSGATSVAGSGGVITISSTNTTYATRPNPAAIKFINPLATTPTTVSYDGNTATTIQYSDVGAAPQSGINLSAIDWTSGSTDFKLPASIMPKEALLDLAYVNSADPTAATGVQAGDIIQTNDNKLYYVNTASTAGVATSTTEIKVGNAAHASSAGQVDNSFQVYNGSTAIGNGFNGGAAKNVAFYNGLIVGASSTATANTVVTSNGVFLNNLWGMTNGTSLAAGNAGIAGSIKIVGSTGITVSANTAGIISITGTTYATRPNPYTLTAIYGTGTTSATYSGAAANTFYGGNKLIVATANTKTTAQDTANTTTFVNLLTRVTSSTYEVSSYLQLKGSGATTVTATSAGVITISSTNTTYSTRPNPSALVLQGGGAQVISYTGSSAATLNIAAGTGVSVSTAAGKITIGATAYSGTSPISVSGFSITHTTSGVTAGTYGSSASTISIGSGATTTSINIPQVVVDAKGHVTAAYNRAIQFGVSQTLTEGDVVGTVLGKTLYCGVTWDTF